MTTYMLLPRLCLSRMVASRPFGRTVRASLVLAGAAVLLAGGPRPASAGGFSAAVDPPRFELRAKPGETVRRTIDIVQVSPEGGKYRVYTNDWTLDERGDVAFFDHLQPGSCRPWVSLEAHDVQIPGNSRLRYRVEFSPPAGVSPTECRLAIMFQGEPSDVEADGLKVPVSGRIAVIVYLSVGDVQPKVDVVDTGWSRQNGTWTPSLTLINRGSATARVGGHLEILPLPGAMSGNTGAPGREAAPSIRSVPSALPLLPGQHREVLLLDDRGKPLGPLPGSSEIRGRLSLGYAATQSLQVDRPLAPSPVGPAGTVHADPSAASAPAGPTGDGRASPK